MGKMGDSLSVSGTLRRMRSQPRRLRRSQRLGTTPNFDEEKEEEPEFREPFLAATRQM